MHIELTDHLRCPRPHDESFLILLPERMEGRRVMAGVLACPACGWQCAWEDGVPDFGGGWTADGSLALPAHAVPAMLGLEGPGGWIALAGRAAALAEELAALMPGVGIVAVNPPATLPASENVHMLRSGAWPLKAHAMRGIIAGADAMAWVDAMSGSLLSGRRMIGEGEPPEAVEVLASGGGVWVGRKRVESRE